MLRKKMLPVLMSGMALAVMIIACNDGAQEGVQEIEGTVAIIQPKTKPVTAVTAATTSNGEYVVITWDAVDDVVNYNVIVQQENAMGNASLSAFAGVGYTGPQCVYKYSLADGSQSSNENWNRYSVRLTVANVRSNTVSGKRYRFGVYPTDRGDIFGTSDITWSNYIMF
jgi:hypothetical protein